MRAVDEREGAAEAPELGPGAEHDVLGLGRQRRGERDERAEPERSLRRRWTTAWSRASQAAAGTRHFCAAAAMSIVRAAAPCLRSDSLLAHAGRAVGVLVAVVLVAVGLDERTRRIEAPSSSAISTGSELRMPCPISER